MAETTFPVSETIFSNFETWINLIETIEQKLTTLMNDHKISQEKLLPTYILSLKSILKLLQYVNIYYNYVSSIRDDSVINKN